MSGQLISSNEHTEPVVTTVSIDALPTSIFGKSGQFDLELSLRSSAAIHISSGDQTNHHDDGVRRHTVRRQTADRAAASEARGFPSRSRV